jgi:hypothetical protein
MTKLQLDYFTAYSGLKMSRDAQLFDYDLERLQPRDERAPRTTQEPES